jgi:penicillin-binding protein 2
VYFYQAAREVGIDRLAYYARVFGLGASTGLEPGPEAAGLVPTRAWKARRFGEPWVEGETLSAGIGQGFNLWTPIQLAAVYAAVANGGTRYQPFVVERVEDPHGRVLRTRRPRVSARLPISSETLRRVRDALLGVVQERRGTGGALRKLPGEVEAAGKTGTAQVVALSEDPPTDEEEIELALRDHAWFVGYAPAGAPELVVAVLVEHGGHGASAAAPIAREVLAAWLTPEGEPHARR